jgi:hypothetical protein
MSFSNKLFIEESLTFNWHLSLMNYKLFKFSQNVICFKDSPYGEETKKMYQWSDLDQLDAALIIDVKAHERNVFFLRRIHVATFGLVPANYSP